MYIDSFIQILNHIQRFGTFVIIVINIYTIYKILYGFLLNIGLLKSVDFTIALIQRVSTVPPLGPYTEFTPITFDRLPTPHSSSRIPTTPAYFTQYPPVPRAPLAQPGYLGLERASNRTLESSQSALLIQTSIFPTVSEVVEYISCKLTTIQSFLSHIQVSPITPLFQIASCAGQIKNTITALTQYIF